MSAVAEVYEASQLNHANDNKRHRGTNDEMEIRARFLIAYAAEHHPVTVRQLYYAATVAGVPGIQKDDNGYNAVQGQVVKLRRAGRMPYHQIADLTRWTRRPQTFNSVYDALNDTAALYRRALWRDKPYQLEIWVEKDALAGAIMPVTFKYDVPLMVCRGFSSETYAYEAVEAWWASGKEAHVYHMGDFDRSGQDAAADLERKLRRFATVRRVDMVFHRLALTPELIRDWNLPTRAPKRLTTADKRWPYEFACELDAIPPDRLRTLVRDVCSEYMPDHEMKELLAAEESEREMLTNWVERDLIG